MTTQLDRETTAWRFVEIPKISPGSKIPWFTTLSHPEPISADGDATYARTAHAKRMGTMLTACGEPARNWPRMFDQAFPPSSSHICVACLDEVRRSRKKPEAATPRRKRTR